MVKFYFKIRYERSQLATLNVTQKGLVKLVLDVVKFCEEINATYELVVLQPGDELYDYETDDDYTDGFLVW